MPPPQTTKSPSIVTAVIFDMDGVLTDSEPLINAAAIAMFKEFGLDVLPSDFVPFVGTGEDRYIGGVAELYHFPIDLPAAKRRHCTKFTWNWCQRGWKCSRVPSTWSPSVGRHG